LKDEEEVKQVKNQGKNPSKDEGGGEARQDRTQIQESSQAQKQIQEMQRWKESNGLDRQGQTS